MSGSTIGGVLGAAAGYWVSGGTMQGAQIGWMLGSYAGGAIDPDVIPGQRLADAQTQTVAEGAPRPIIKGTVRVAGNVIHAGPLDEHRHEDAVGKGSGQVQESFTYTRTFAIRVVGHEIGNYSRIWADDKLSYDVRDPAQWPEAADAIAALAGDTAKFSTYITLYKGDEFQLPDPSLEVLPADYQGGVGEVNAHRGTAYVVFTDYPCPNGSIPQFAFEVSECGDSTTSVADVPWVHGDTGSLQSIFGIAVKGLSCFAAGWNNNLRRAIDGGRNWEAVDYITTTGWDPADAIEGLWWDSSSNSDGDWYMAKADAVAVSYNGGTMWSNYITPPHQLVSRIGPGGGVHKISDGVWAGAAETTNTVIFKPQELSSDADVDLGADYGRATAVGEFLGSKLIGTDTGDIRTAGGTLRHAVAGNQIVQFATDSISIIIAVWGSGGYSCSDDGGSTWVDYAGGTIHGCVYARGRFYFVAAQSIAASDDGITLTQVDTYFAGNANSSLIATDGFSVLATTQTGKTSALPSSASIPDLASGWHIDDLGNVVGDTSTTVDRCVAQLDETVLDFLAMVGLSDAQVDVTALAGIEVRGFTVGQQMPAAEALRELQKFYLFDMAEWGDSGDTGTKLRAILRGGPVLFDITDANLLAADESQDTRPQSIEFARKLNLVTSDIDSDYNPTKQTAERRTDNIKAVGETSFTLSVVTIRTEAAPKADILLKVQWEQALGRTRFMLPGEYAALTPSDILTNGGKRWRAERCEYVDGTVGVDAVRDRAHAYVSNALPGYAPPPSVPPSTLRGPTEFVAFNSPRLRTSEATTGMQVGVSGVLDGWIGADLYVSVDGGASEQLVKTIMGETTMGSLTADCDAGATDLIAVKVIHNHELDSVTDEQIAARANGFAIITGGEAELGQFKTATETVIPVAKGETPYDLTDITRGELETIAAPHYFGDRFTMLDTLTFIEFDASLAGKTIIFRPVSRGTPRANNRTYSVVFNPKFTGPEEVSFLLDETGDILLDETGAYLQD